MLDLRIALTVGLLDGFTERQSVISLRRPAENFDETGLKAPRTIFIDSI